jgi:transcriptional regulator with XRE-family HTH domain
MSLQPSLPTALATALRTARTTRGLSISALAAQGGVSPRLVSEFERGKRPHISLDTALRLLHLVRVPLSIAASPTEVSEEVARAERAARRRDTWVGH